MGVGLALTVRSARGRTITTWVVWALVAIVPLIVEAVQRAAGVAARAQDEVLVVEGAGRRLLDTGTPYLGRGALAGLADPILGYTPYQPAMAVFGLPRAIGGTSWLTDARLWFALVTAACLAIAIHRLGGTTPTVIRALQAATVLPVCALTLATGGDDMPVLALTLLGLAYLATGRSTSAGVTVGVAAALKLLAWPVALVLLVVALVTRRRGMALALVGIPVLTALPSVLLDPAAFVENVIRFPAGQGLVHSPAASPFPGHLLAGAFPGGHALALALLGVSAAGLAWWLWRRPPRTAADAAALCAVGLLAAILLLPASRFGYLLYPIAYAVWIPALRTAERSVAAPADQVRAAPAT